MKIRRILPLIAAVLGLLSACSLRQEAPPNYAPAEENRLVIYTSHKEEVYHPLVREFEERTGIWVEVVTGGTNELLKQIVAEEDAPRADLIFGGGIESLSSYRDYFLPYRSESAEQIASQFRDPDDRWTPFSALPVVLIYNTKLVNPEHLQSWSDLDRAEFAGRIAFADPSKSGSSFTALVTLICASEDREGCLARFAADLQGRQLDASGDVLTAVADGSCLVGITLEETALQRIAAGDDIAMVYPTDGTSCVPDGSAIVAGAPHEDNAKRFLDFTVSSEVQQLLGSRFYRRSVRVDAAPDAHLESLDSLSLVEYDARQAADHRSDLLKQWAELLKKEESQ